MPSKCNWQVTRRSSLAWLGLSLSWSAIASLTARATEPSLKWPYEVEAGIFHIHADFEISTNSQFIGELEQLVNDVGQMLSMPEPTEAMHMVLFDRGEEYRRYMDHYFPKLPARRALFIQQRGTGMLFAHRHPDMATDLRHESVHAILNQCDRTLPLWLDEGLAEYFEVAASERWSGHPHLRWLKTLSLNDVPDIAQLEQLNDVALMKSEHYRDAWAWVHFLLHRRQSTRTLLTNQLAAFRSASVVAPLSRDLAQQFPNYRSEFISHFSAL